MNAPYNRHIPLEGAHNVRDLGGYPTSTGATTRWRSFLRADALYGLSRADVDTLLETGLRTVIDLRSDMEIAYQPSVFASHAAVDYHQIPLFDRLAPADVMFREKNISDLSARYIEAVDCCRPAFLKVVDTITGGKDGAVLFNCTAGKDRTGIIAAMLLSLANVDKKVIAQDYALTASLAATLMDHLRSKARARGMDEASSTMLLSSEPGAMMTFLDHVEARHGGFHRYLLDGNERVEQVDLLRQRIIEIESTR